jgi:two-component system sensor histidine kinase YesM
MIKRLNIFSKVVLLIVLLLVPIIILYSFSNHVSVGVVENEIRSRNLNRLSIFQNQIDSEIEKLSSYLLALSADTDISIYKSIELYNDYEALQIKSRILEKMNLYRAQNNWASEINLYSVNAKEAIGSVQAKYDEERLNRQMSSNWRLTEKIKDGKKGRYFIRHVVQPASTEFDVQSARLIIEGEFPVENIKSYLEQINDTLSSPFFYLDGLPPLEELIQYIQDKQLPGEGSFTRKLDESTYLVSYVRSRVVDGAILMDYIPLKTILSPITSSNLLFYISVILLLTLSLLASLLLYRNVHRPIRQLMKSMKGLEQGIYDTRIKLGMNPEFDFLFSHFNQMADQIQNLIVKVYEEKINAHEATLKQLQAQINPHFLYNCLYYIHNMSNIGNEEAVQAMTLHLGEYYRYTTHIESQMVSLEEELELVVNFLEIYRLRMQRIEYEIDVPEPMKELQIPRLILQPIVENALIHGIEPKIGTGTLSIYGYYGETEARLTVEDNGVGLTDNQLAELQNTIKSPMTKEMGCGIWNVHQRLSYQFGEDAGLHLYHSAEGGLCVELRWRWKRPEDAGKMDGKV